MTSPLARRTFLESSLAAVAVVAFCPETRSWASGGGGIAIPSLDGQLLTDAATLSAAADDFGHIIHRAPTAVLVPGSVHDIVKLVKFAKKHGIQVGAAHGIGGSHSTYGQAEVQAGVVIDSSALATIHEINAHDALVDAGVEWIDLLSATVPHGKSPPTLTDYIELSVGGTLSAGGVGGQAFRSGFQVDNVLELEVVTGEGKLVTCSPSHKSKLFDAVRAGLGQFGIITKARVRLVAVPSMARTYTATYDDVHVFTADQEMLIEDGRFDYVEGSVVAAPAGGWQFQLEVVKYFNPSSPPNDAAQLAGLSFLAGTQVVADGTYFDFANRIAPTVAFLKLVGAWGLPHPWIDLFLPGPQTASFVDNVLSTLTVADTGNGPILLYPMKRSSLGTPFARVPSTAHVFLFSILRFAPPIQAVVDAMVAQNRVIFDAATAIGGKRYPIGSVALSHADWVAHFGPVWGDFEDAKDEFDPENVLTPGQGIF